MSERDRPRSTRRREALRRRDGARRRELRSASGRGARALRRERGGQIDADQAAGRRASARQLRRRDPRRRQDGRVPFDTRRGACRHRHHSPGTGAVPGHDGGREPVPRRVSATASGASTGIASTRSPLQRSPTVASSSTRRPGSAISVSASSSSSRSRAPLDASRRCWSWTSPPPRWRATRSTPCSTWCAACVAATSPACSSRTSSTRCSRSPTVSRCCAMAAHRAR